MLTCGQDFPRADGEEPVDLKISRPALYLPACCGELWSAADAQGEPVGKAPQGADGGAPRSASTACFGGSPRRHGYPGFVQLLRLEEGPKVLKLKG